ncbi:MAG: hypothetical protein HY678_10935 [Chloroflexi bacterium]|nr:hypothetical protein [Chloroflexota bacterium]
MVPVISSNHRSLRLLFGGAMFLFSLALGLACRWEAEQIHYTVINDTITTVDVVFFTARAAVFGELLESYDELSVGQVETSLQQCSIPFCDMPSGHRASDFYQIREAYDNFFVARESATSEILFKQRLTYDEFKARDWTIRISDQR